jgi:hypothetical protein
MKPERLITKSFFDPIFEHEYGLTRTFGVYLHVCQRVDLAVRAMQAADKAGKLHPIGNVEGRDFREGQSWNELVANPQTQDRNTRWGAAEILLERVDELFGATLDKFSGANQEINDVEGFKKALAPLALKIEKWLANPKQWTNENRLPRSTSFMDYNEENLGTVYLVQMNGWEDMKLLERPKTGIWSFAEPIEIEEDVKIDEPSDMDGPDL